MPPSSGDFERLELLDFEDSSENSSFSFFEVLRKTWVPVVSVALCVHVWKWENVLYEFMADKEKCLNRVEANLEIKAIYLPPLVFPCLGYKMFPLFLPGGW